VIADRWLLEANLGEMGTVHAWTLATLGADLQTQADPYAAYDALASSAPIGCRGASSHLGPRAMDLRDLNTGRPAALLMPFGETTGSAPPSRAELMRATLESCAFAIRAGREWLDAVLEDDGGAFVIAGGLGRSSFFCHALASVLGREVVAGPVEASALGAAMCAAVAAGLASDLPAAAERLGRAHRRYPIDENDVDEYEDAYELWVEREEQLEGL
jgi:sugar (pentulose or hexulose) kinase